MHSKNKCTPTKNHPPVIEPLPVLDQMLIDPLGPRPQLIRPSSAAPTLVTLAAHLALDLVHAPLAQVRRQIRPQTGLPQEPQTLRRVERLVRKVAIAQDVPQRLALHVIQVADQLLVALARLNVQLLAQDLEALLLLVHVALLERLLVQVPINHVKTMSVRIFPFRKANLRISRTQS